jgi:lysozyme
MKITNIREQLLRDEDEKLHAYQDKFGYWTIGVGRLIDHRRGGGITKKESEYLLNNDIKRVKKELKAKLVWFESLDEVRQGALLNMAFQMGVEGLLTFVNTLRYIELGQYRKASEHMLESLWATQTPARAKRIAKQMETGEWQ